MQASVSSLFVLKGQWEASFTWDWINISDLLKFGHPELLLCWSVWMVIFSRSWICECLEISHLRLESPGSCRIVFVNICWDLYCFLISHAQVPHEHLWCVSVSVFRENISFCECLYSHRHWVFVSKQECLLLNKILLTAWYCWPFRCSYGKQQCSAI